MKCPYILFGSYVNSTTERIYNNDNQEEKVVYKSIETREIAHCLKEDCGAYVNGQCNYHQTEKARELQ